jgi:anti-sigma regulatory factor (Ser/Thr protein kinase)
MEAGLRTQLDGVHRFEPDVASVPAARRLAREFAEPLMSSEQRSNLDLAVTEVVSNAVRHSGAADEVLLALTGKDGYLCVRVTDGGTGLVPQPGAMATEPGAGFGLFLVEQITRRWGMTREGGKTRVWFEIDFT